MLVTVRRGRVVGVALLMAALAEQARLQRGRLGEREKGEEGGEAAHE